VSPFGYRGGIIGDAGDPSARDVALALVRAADACCRREEVRALLYYGLTAADDTVLVQALAEEHVPAFVVGAHCELSVRWPTLDAYFTALGERGRRLRSKYRQAERDTAVRWRTLSAEGRGCGVSLSEAAIELFSRTARNHGDTLPPVGLYRALLEEWTGPRHLLVGESADGRVRSALLVLQRGTTLFPKCFGATARGDYFHLTFAKTIELAIRLGATRIAYGGGSHDAKLLRGAELVWLLGAIVAYDGELSGALRLAVPAYADAKQQYFSGLAARYAVRRRAGLGNRALPPSFLGATSAGVLP